MIVRIHPGHVVAGPEIEHLGGGLAAVPDAVGAALVNAGHAGPAGPAPAPTAEAPAPPGSASLKAPKPRPRG